MKSTVVTFAERLKTARLRAGLTQAELAERAGLTHAAVSYLESGKRKPLLETAFALAFALSISINRLVK